MPILTPDGERVPVGNRLPVLPLRDVVFFPYIVMPLLVGRSGSVAAVDAAARAENASADGEGQYLLAVTQRHAEADDPAAADLYRVGVVVRVLQRTPLANGAIKLLLEGVARAPVSRYAKSGGVLRATLASSAAASDDGATQATALSRRVMSQFEEYVALQRRIPGEVVSIIQNAQTPARRALAIAAHLSVAPSARQKLLEAETLVGPASRCSTRRSPARSNCCGWSRRSSRTCAGRCSRTSASSTCRSSSRRSTVNSGQEDDDLADLEAQVERKGLPEPVKARVLRELRKMRRMSPIAPESTVSRNFVDWVLALPWTARTDDVLDVAHARRILDEDHYGLEPVKDRILDYIGVLSLVGRLEGPILCLVGPPGVGKTSLGRSVARALGRKFVRMSLGGVRDEAEIRGHRRTYIGVDAGARPAGHAPRRGGEPGDPARRGGQAGRRTIAAIRRRRCSRCSTPSRTARSTITTWRSTTTCRRCCSSPRPTTCRAFPEPLRDRMEVIRLPGYLDQEKLAIARQFLVPQAAAQRTAWRRRR